MATKRHDPLSQDELANLLVETGEHHHQAYAESDGVDPEWALWYAGFLQARMWDRAGSLPTRSRLVYLLLRGEAEHGESGDDAPWSQFYANVILTDLGRH